MMAGLRWTVAAFALFAGTHALADEPAPTAEVHWGAVAVAALREEIAAAPDEGLVAPVTAQLDRAVLAGDPAAVDRAAGDLALRLARIILLGCSTAQERAGWSIRDSDDRIDLSPRIDAALRDGTLHEFFDGLRPHHPDYAALVRAYRAETDPARRTKLARNLERWRWLPHDLGPDYLLVNTAAFHVDLWRGGQKIGRWRTINGKPKSPTPVFSATVTGVTLNPWWDIPANIVRESVGALVRNHPDTARARGYVWGGGRYRQRPGPNNSLGLMKLAMPNPYSVYLHDTPSKALFQKDVRAFSHGCVRVDDALGFAAMLLSGVRSREDIDALVARGETVTVDLARPVPVYIAYFTAESGEGGAVSLLDDVYGRDGRMGDAANPARLCAY